MGRRWMAFLVLMGLSSGLAFGQGPVRADLARLQGVWRGWLTSAADERTEREPVKVTIQGEILTLELEDEEPDVVSFHLDSTAIPGRIDLEDPEGDEAGGMPGIYALRGDSLRICFNASGKDRPTAFRPSEKCDLLVLKRIQGGGNTAPDKGRALAIRKGFLPGHGTGVYCLAYAPDGTMLASAGADGLVKLRGLRPGQRDMILKGDGVSVQSLAFSPNGRLLASADEGGTVRLWDLRTGRGRATLRGHRESIRAMAFSCDGRTLATGSVEGRITLWDAATSRAVATFVSPGGVFCLAISPDGKTLATAGDDRAVRLWDLAGRRVRDTLLFPTAIVWSAAYSPDGKLLACGGQGPIRVWDASGRFRVTLRGHSDAVLGLAFSPHGLLASSGYDGNTLLWDVGRGKKRADLQALGQNIFGLHCVAFSPDGKALATGGMSVIELWDVRE